MDREYMLRVADAVEGLGRGEPVGPLNKFDMTIWGYYGSAGCIAGTACALMVEDGELDEMPASSTAMVSLAAEHMRLSPSDGVFFGRLRLGRQGFGRDCYYMLSTITSAEATAELRHLVAGEAA